MAGKFMKIRRICIPLLTMVVIASQLCGCAASTKKEMANTLNVDTSQEIIIEVPEPDFEVQGTYQQLDWIELGKLTDCAEIRETVDNYFNNATGDDGLKYGPFYIDTEGNQCTNNTLKVVLGNRYVAEMFATGGNVDTEKIDSTNLGAIEVNADGAEDTEDTPMTSSLNSSLDAIYTDLSDTDRTSALFNAYFNLLPDSTPNYFNGGDTLSRGEAMALVTRATTPVGTLGLVDGFEEAVTGTDYDQYINYAAQQNNNAYINTQDKSLTADNFKGAMSRAEFIYLIMNNVYTAETVSTFDTTSTSLKDCTNAGDLSSELKITDSDRCSAYTLSHSLQNVDKGVPDPLYKSLAMAADKGIISQETRWNEGITKSEAIEIIVNAFNAYYEENGYLINTATKGSTQALETAAKALWAKQDKNDMSCTEEEFIADYIAELSSGMTPEQFEESIPGKYSISFAEELAENDKQMYIDSLWESYGGDKLTCDKETFTKEYNEYADEKGDSYNEEDFAKYITEKYGKQETDKAEQEDKTDNSNSTPDNDSNNGNNGDSSGNDDTPVYTPPVQQEPVEQPPAQPEPVYTPPVEQPPVDNGNSGGNTSSDDGDAGYNPFANGGGDDFESMSGWGHTN